MENSKKDIITLAMGSGGIEMDELIKSFKFDNRGNWLNYDNDSATFNLNKNHKLVFTTDSFTIDPIFFPGGDIGKIAVCGTINDLSVMGAEPIGLSLGFVIEEGLPKADLQKIVESINKISIETNIPIATGDTKVMEKGKLDKIIINVSGIGIVKNEVFLDKEIKPGDKLIISGGLGEHAVALLSKRFDYQTNIITDSKPLLKEMREIRKHIKFAKDPTRGGLAAVLNEISGKYNIGFNLVEEDIPAKKEVRKVTEMLGINMYELACEGRIICICSSENADIVVSKLKQYNPDAAIIGEVTLDKKVVLKTFLGSRILPHPSGRIVPRIC